MLARLRPAAGEIGEALEELNALRSQPVGLLRLSVPRIALELVVLPALPGFRHAQPGIKVEVFDTFGSLMVMAFNFYHPPFDNVKLRRAVLSAVSQKDFVDSVVGEQQTLVVQRRGECPHGRLARCRLLVLAFHHRLGGRGATR